MSRLLNLFINSSKSVLKIGVVLSDKEKMKNLEMFVRINLYIRILNNDISVFYIRLGRKL